MTLLLTDDESDDGSDKQRAGKKVWTSSNPAVDEMAKALRVSVVLGIVDDCTDEKDQNEVKKKHDLNNNSNNSNERGENTIVVESETRQREGSREGEDGGRERGERGGERKGMRKLESRLRGMTKRDLLEMWKERKEGTREEGEQKTGKLL